MFKLYKVAKVTSVMVKNATQKDAMDPQPLSRNQACRPGT